MSMTLLRDQPEFHFKTSFSSEQLAENDVAIPFFEQLLKAGLITESDKLRLELAFREALINAYEHGNLDLHSIWKDDFSESGEDRYSKVRAERQRDPKYASRQVTVELELVDKTIVMTLQDQGRGFSYMRSEQKNDQIVKLHGRGFDIIYSVVDEVEFFDQGRGIRMKKAIS